MGEKLLVVGLGNPGEKYADNRHNVGHMVIDALQKAGVPKGMVAKKTTVFMNNSGEEVKKLVEKYHKYHKYHGYHKLYIVHDDLDIRLGDYKIQKGKGPRQQRGVESIEEALGTADFWRVRIGVDNRDPGNRTPGEQYVLQDFTQDERVIVEKVIKDVVAQLIARFGAD